LASVDCETVAQHLDFGVSTPQEGQGDSQKDNQNSESDPKDSDSDPNPQDPKDGENETAASPPEVPQEVNALYERLLQEIEANSEPLDIEGKVVETPRRGRDY
jgi:hypothetical protein